jgi:hypothetical protein
MLLQAHADLVGEVMDLGKRRAALAVSTRFEAQNISANNAPMGTDSVVWDGSVIDESFDMLLADVQEFCGVSGAEFRCTGANESWDWSGPGFWVGRGGGLRVR